MITAAAEIVRSCRDSRGSVGRTGLTCSPDTSIDAARSAAADAASAWQDASNAAFVQYSVTYRTVVSDEKPDTVADAGIALVLTFLVGPETYTVVKIYAPKADIFDANGDVNVSDDRVIGLIDALLSGSFCDPFGNALLSFVSAHKEEDRGT